MQGVIDMNKYIEMKKRHQEEVNNNEALRKGLAEAIKQYMADCNY